MGVFRAVICTALAAAALLAFSLPSYAQCARSDYQKSPLGGGIKSDSQGLVIEVGRATGNVPFVKAAFNRNYPDNPPMGAGWYDDSLGPVTFGDEYKGRWPIYNPQYFAAISGNYLAVRFYGSWSDGGTLRPFDIYKDCTATQTAWRYYNAYDRYPNLVVVVTWDRPYVGFSHRKLKLAELLRKRKPRVR
ncbi:hypothetical protein ACQR1Q_34920 [Bradyrhizobium oligotrophicum]|uniref:hypothetical protein n=1 Tax=Bradyrhizobium oligotrophicum TaxID=44255 RepID=UPI003EBF730B